MCADIPHGLSAVMAGSFLYPGIPDVIPYTVSIDGIPDEELTGSA